MGYGYHSLTVYSVEYLVIPFNPTSISGRKEVLSKKLSTFDTRTGPLDVPELKRVPEDNDLRLGGGSGQEQSRSKLKFTSLRVFRS